MLPHYLVDVICLPVFINIYIVIILLCLFIYVFFFLNLFLVFFAGPHWKKVCYCVL